MKRKGTIRILALLIGLGLSGCFSEKQTEHTEVIFHQLNMLSKENWLIQSTPEMISLKIISDGKTAGTASCKVNITFEEAAYYSGILEDTLLWMKAQDEYGLTFLTSLHNIPAAVYGCIVSEEETPLCQGAVFFSRSGKYQLTTEKPCAFDALFESFTLNMEE